MKQMFSFKDKLNGEEIEFSLVRPNRSEKEDIEIYYASMLSKLMNMGVQTKASVDKYYSDNGDSALPKKDQSYYYDLQKKLASYQEEIIRVGNDTDKKLELYIKISEAQENMRKFTSYYSVIYDNTAEVKARDKTIDFCMLNFSCKNGEKLFDVEEEDFQKRAIKQYELLDDLKSGEDSDFWDSVVDRLVFMFTIWYMDLANEEKEFKTYYESYFQSKVLNPEEPEEEELEEEKPEEEKEQ